MKWLYWSYLVPELNKKTKECRSAIDKDEYRDHFENNLFKLKKYVGFLSEKSGINNDELLEKYNKEDFDTVIADLTLKRLEDITNYFRSRFLVAMAASDSNKTAIEDQYGHDYLPMLKNDYHNENLANFCLNLRSKYKIIETKTKLIQKADPVYMIPTSNYGRAHFYAPYKILGNLHIDTYWFNLGAIWLLTLVFYFTLYTDLLRKAINYFGRIEKA